MSDGTRRNNTRSLRIRITPPLNSTGTEKIWNGNTWVKQSNALVRARAKAMEHTKIVKELEKSIEMYTTEIERLKKINPRPYTLPSFIAHLEGMKDAFITAENDAVDSITKFYYLRNGTPKGGRSKKRR
jgi:hypothetical protein